MKSTEQEPHESGEMHSPASNAAADGAWDDRERIEALIEHVWNLRNGRPDEARAQLDEIERLSEGSQVSNDFLRRRLTFIRQVVQPKETTRDVDASISTAQNVVDAARALGSSLWSARALNVIGGALHRLGDYTAALERFDEARSLFESVGDHRAVALVNNNIGIVLNSMGRPIEALERSLESIEYYSAVGDPAGLALAHRDAAIHFDQLGQFDNAIEHYLRSKSGYDALGDEVGSAYALLSLGVLEANMGDHAPAMEKLTAAVAVFERHSNTELRIAALVGMTHVYESTGNLQALIETFEHGMDITRSYYRRDSHASMCYRAAGAYLKSDDVVKAEQAFNESFVIFNEIGDRLGVARSTFGLGLVAAKEGRPEDACQHLQNALSIAVEIQSLSVICNCHSNLAEQKHSCGEFEEAYEHLRSARALDEEIAQDEVRSKFQNLEASRKIELAHKEAEIERLRNVELVEAHAALQQAHGQLKQAQAQLVHAEKMASLGQLTAGIAHEINNPVNFILNSTSPLRRDLDEVRIAIDDVIAALPDELRASSEALLREREISEMRDEIDSLLRGIEDGATRTAHIVRSLRTFSRLDEDELKVVDLHEGIESTITLLHPKLDVRVEVCREYADIPHVECYPGQINQVVMNLLTNAIDAIPSNGTVTITTETVDNANVRIHVRDTGTGIAPENVARIFDPFFTTKPVGAGQGLGLAIAHSIVEKHHGALHVSTSPNGSQFTIELPLRQQPITDTSHQP